MIKLKKKRKLLTAMGTALSIIAIKSQCLAFSSVLNGGSNGSSGSIGTAEVTTATENIKRVITSIAMPLRRCSNICKYSCCCIENDCKCE